MRRPYVFSVKKLKSLLLLFSLGFVSMDYSLGKRDEHVFLLHGLARSSSSMKGMERFLKDHNFSVTNLDYPSRKFSIPELAKQVRERISENPKSRSAEKIHFVTHSMGGILLRQIQSVDPLPNIGKAVMLGPPNQGSEIVDKLGKMKIFKMINGPASLQLGTDPESIPNILGPVNFELFVIAGTRSINPILSQMIPGTDDGKVAVARTGIEGMQEFLEVQSAHPFLMNNRIAREATLHFLKTGQLP